MLWPEKIEMDIQDEGDKVALRRLMGRLTIGVTCSAITILELGRIGAKCGGRMVELTQEYGAGKSICAGAEFA